eukprot:TRINITY_DN75611_c0_g1_i1.p1 TRINITY_DN75611_c0_g1~~TRINITY_DN75611_c0_g1_i1.p1  ORF type:complete len:131 (-),score=18.76 TRINITY_DN75611_c0_g1_i1:107-499(-)
MGGPGRGGHSNDVLTLQGHTPSGLKALWSALAKLFIRLRYLGLAGYALEWLLEACHSSHRLHKLLRHINTPKFHLLAISMVLAGHVAEHLHHEEEHHHQETHLAHLRSELAKRKLALLPRIGRAASVPCI